MMSCRRLFQMFSSALRPEWNVHFNQAALAHTIKVERYWNAPIPKIGGKPQLKSKHDIYHVVRIDNGPKDLSVILTEDSTDFGIEGELVTLPKRFSRKLIYSGKAVYASPENIAEYAAKATATQTLSGRRMALWLKEHGTFDCPLPADVSWTLTQEILARSLFKNHNVSLPPSAITLPGYDITNENVEYGQEHQVQISVNQMEPIPIKISIRERTS